MIMLSRLGLTSQKKEVSNTDKNASNFVALSKPTNNSNDNSRGSNVNVSNEGHQQHQNANTKCCSPKKVAVLNDNIDIAEYEEEHEQSSSASSKHMNEEIVVSSKSESTGPDLYAIIKELEQQYDDNCFIKRSINNELVKRYADVKTANDFTLADHLNVKIVKPQCKIIYALDSDSYDVYKEFFAKLIFQLQNGINQHDVEEELNFGKTKSTENMDLNIEKSSYTVNYCEVIMRRNFKDFDLNGSMYDENRQDLMNLLKSKFSEKFSSYKETTIPDEWSYRLMEEESYISLTSIHNDFPNGRLNMIYADKDDDKTGFIINFDDHLQFVISTSSGNIGRIFIKMKKLLTSNCLEDVEYLKHEQLGYVTVNPKYIGSGMSIRLYIKMPYVNLLDDVDEIYLKDLNLTIKSADFKNRKLMILENQRTLSITEEEIFNNIIDGFNRLYELNVELENTFPDAVNNNVMSVESLTRLSGKINNCHNCRNYTKKYLTDVIISQYGLVSSTYHGLLSHTIRANAFYPQSLYPKATDPDCYSTFSRFFNPIILDINNANQFLHHPTPIYTNPNSAELNFTIDHKLIKHYRVRFSRNLKNYPFPMLTSPKQRSQIENKIVSALTKMSSLIKGRYIKFNDISTDPMFNMICMYRLVPQINSLVKKASYFYRDWPKNRGIFIADNNSEFSDHILYILVNEDDHLQVISLSLTGTRLDVCYTKAITVMQLLDEYLNNEYAKKLRYGYLSSNPANVGCGMRLSACVHLKYLNNDRATLAEFCREYNINYRGLTGAGSRVVDSLFEISLKLNMNYQEHQLLLMFVQRIRQLLILECAMYPDGSVAPPERMSSGIGHRVSTKIIDETKVLPLVVVDYIRKVKKQDYEIIYSCEEGALNSANWKEKYTENIIDCEQLIRTLTHRNSAEVVDIMIRKSGSEDANNNNLGNSTAVSLMYR